MPQVHSEALLRYHRKDNMVRLTETGLTNHELREVLVGLWARLDADDRADHIRELTSYQEDPASWLSPVASALAVPETHDGFIDLLRARRIEHEDLPGRPSDA